MDWTAFALLSAVTFAVVSIIDKRLLSVNVKMIQAYYAWLGTALVTLSLLVLIVFGIHDELTLGRVLTAYGAGLSWGMGLVLTFIGVKWEEVSRATAIYQTFPIFVAIFAVIFLGETIGFGQGAAIGVIVLGAYLISLRKLSLGAAFRPSKALPLLVLASFLVGMGHFGSKVALEDMSVSTVYVFRSLGMASSLLLFLRPSVVAEMVSNAKHPATRWLIIGNLFILAPLAVAFALIATDLGPVSLASSVVATRPMFVFLFAALLTKTSLHFMGEALNRDALVVKGAAVFLVVSGLISLQVL